MSTRVRSTQPAISFDLGSRILYTRRAAVARKKGSGWGLFEGWLGTSIEADELLAGFDPGPEINKAIFEWDKRGSGTVIGLVKRGIGKSYSSSWRNTYAGEDYDPGYFVPHEWRWFYVVRHHLKQTDYILVPVENAQPVAYAAFPPS